MLTLTASDADLVAEVTPDRRERRILLVALGASLLLHALAITLLPGLRISPPTEPVTLTVELQEPPPIPQVAPQPQEVPRPVAPPKRAEPPKPEPVPPPPQIIERLEPPPVRESEVFTAPPPPPPQPETKPEPVAEPTPVPRTEPHAEVNLRPAPPVALAPPVATAQPDEPDPALLRIYGQQVSGILGRLQRYPPAARMRGWQGTAEVNIRIGAGGKVEDVLIARSSGYPLLDREALDMVKDSQPLPPPPAALATRAFTLHIPVVFRLLR